MIFLHIEKEPVHDYVRQALFFALLTFSRGQRTMESF